MSGTPIDSALVAELRRDTGAGMMDCKKALAESGGDKAKAIEYLRKKGIAAAEKRADRSAKEGMIALAVAADGRTGALVEINSETDFVAKNDLFRKFGQDVAAVVLAWNDAAGKDTDVLLDRPLPSGAKIRDELTNLTGKIGEKLAVGRFARLHVPTGGIGTYIHSDTKLGVMVGLAGADLAQADVKILGRDLAMQVAAASPTYVRRDEIPTAKIESERVVETDRARNEGKPEAAVAKIAEGRINKWMSEVVLLEQPFVKDPKVIIKDLVAATAKKAGSALEVTSFVRIRVGA